MFTKHGSKGYEYMINIPYADIQTALVIFEVLTARSTKMTLLGGSLLEVTVVSAASIIWVSIIALLMKASG